MNPNFLILFVLLYFAFTKRVDGQIDPPQNQVFNCDEYLDFLANVLRWDTLGSKGLKLPITEMIVKNECSFIGQPFADLVKFYGKPDVEHEWTTLRTEDHVFLYRYKLFTSTLGDRKTFGDKWLDISTNAERIITKFVIFIVDE